MSKLRELARDLGLTTADKIAAPPPKPADDHAKTRERWDRTKKLAFATLEPAALVLVATDGPVSVTLWGAGGVVAQLGHNRGVWPAKVARTAAWKDTVTAAYDKNPFFFLGAQFRVWTPSVAHRDRLAASVLDLIAARSEADGGLATLRAEFADLGPELDLALFELEVHDIAKRLGIASWNDDGLSRWLDLVCRRAGTIAAEQGRKLDEKLLERVMAKVMEGAAQ